MEYVVVSLLNVELRSVLLPLEVDLLQIQQVLVVLHVYLLDLLLQQLLLVVLQHLAPVGLHLVQLPVKLRLFSGICLNLLLDLGYLSLYPVKCPLHGLIFVLREKQLLAEQLEGKVLIPHVTLIDLLLGHNLPLEFHVHVNFHGLQLRTRLRLLVLLGVAGLGGGSLGELIA